MFESLYEWMQKIAFYLVLVTAVLHAVPNQEYRKYVRFFTGLVLVLMILTPLLRVFGTEVEFAEFYEGNSIEKLQEDLQEELQRGGVEDLQRQESSEGEIEVGEIRIG